MQKDGQETDCRTDIRNTIMQITPSRPVFAALMGLILLPWVIVIIMFGQYGTAGKRQDTAVVNTEYASKPNSFHEESVGPWGVLEMERMAIDLPLSVDDLPLSASDFDFAPEPYRSWVLRDTTVAGARQMFVMAGIAENDADTILKTASEDMGLKEIIVHPPDNIVRGFSPTVRTALYTNVGQAQPFRFLGDTIDEWFIDSNISSKIIDALRPLVYKRGKYLFFFRPSTCSSEHRVAI